MRVHKYEHPGKIIKHIFEKHGLGATEAAKKLGVTRTSTSRLFNCRIRISPEMAVRLSIVFGTSVERWIALQSGYDTWLIEKRKNKIAKQVTPLKLKNNTAKTRAA